MEPSCGRIGATWGMAFQIYRNGQRALWAGGALELGVCIVSQRSRRNLSPLYRRHPAKQHLPDVDLGEPDPAGDRSRAFRDTLREAFQPVVRIGAGSWDCFYSILLRGILARLSRPPWDHRVCVAGVDLWYCMGGSGVGAGS